MTTATSSTANMKHILRRYTIASNAVLGQILYAISHHPEEFLEAMSEDGLLSVLTISRDPGSAIPRSIYYAAKVPPPPAPHVHSWRMHSATRIGNDSAVNVRWLCRNCPAESSEVISGPPLVRLP